MSPKARSWIVFIVMVLAFIGLYVTAIGPPLQACIQEYKSGNPNESNPEKPGLIGNLVTCSWRLLGENTEPILALATIALVIGTVGLAIYTRGLWRTTVDMADDARLAAKVQGERTDASIAEAVRAANTMDRQVQQAEQSSERQLRAYLGIELAPTDAQVTTNHALALVFASTVTNCGKTPAYHVAGKADARHIARRLPARHSARNWSSPWTFGSRGLFQAHYRRPRGVGRGDPRETEKRSI